MTKPIRVGVIGLGRQWQRRYQTALRGMPTQMVVGALYDQVYQRAEQESRRLSVPAAPSINDLLERDDVDALLLADPQWFGLWPIQLACRFTKPVYCGVPLGADDVHADAILQQVQEARLPVFMEMPLRIAPATTRLRELLGNELGPARFLFCDAPHGKLNSNALENDSWILGARTSALVDWCAGLLGGDPVRVWAMGNETVGVGSLWWEFADDRGFHIQQRRSPTERHHSRLHILAESGSALVCLPRRVSWTGKDGKHCHTLPKGPPLVEQMLSRFAEVVRDGRPAEPDLADAYRVLRWLRAARHSYRQGHRVDVSAENSPIS
jgi:predicted dehydrogenase